MAIVALTATSRSATPFALTKTTLNSTDTFTVAYVQGNNQVLEVDNGTGGSLNVVITGSTAPATYTVPNSGGATVTTSSKTIPVAAGARQCILLDQMSLFLSGAVTLTATGTMTATLLNG